MKSHLNLVAIASLIIGLPLVGHAGDSVANQVGKTNPKAQRSARKCEFFTGSRIRRPEGDCFAMTRPLAVFTREEIESTGAGNLTTSMRKLNVASW
jgi:hypothetical protein